MELAYFLRDENLNNSRQTETQARDRIIDSGDTRLQNTSCRFSYELTRSFYVLLNQAVAQNKQEQHRQNPNMCFSKSVTEHRRTATPSVSQRCHVRKQYSLLRFCVENKKN